MSFVMFEIGVASWVGLVVLVIVALVFLLLGVAAYHWLVEEWRNDDGDL